MLFGVEPQALRQSGCCVVLNKACNAQKQAIQQKAAPSKVKTWTQMHAHRNTIECSYNNHELQGSSKEGTAGIGDTAEAMAFRVATASIARIMLLATMARNIQASKSTTL
jgi:hypothetical protein